jgi:hypothetical protein
MKTALQTPSSNSCIKSGSSIEKRLKPSGDNLSEKAFCSAYDELANDQEMYFVYQCWDPRFLTKQGFHCGTVHLIVLFIYNSPSGGNPIAPMDIIHASQCSSLGHIPGHAKVMDTIQRNQATWAWAFAEVSNTSNKDSIS